MFTLLVGFLLNKFSIRRAFASFWYLLFPTIFIYLYQLSL